ncbi:hypothetical protein BKA69DRAFT_1126265 [Paraphysoderma sedebokerense]|nr:hypothetical protein BKA69DRAFT_1126265 [Paraphysoderma sedebokerense]
MSDKKSSKSSLFVQDHNSLSLDTSMNSYRSARTTMENQESGQPGNAESYSKASDQETASIPNTASSQHQLSYPTERRASASVFQEYGTFSQQPGVQGSTSKPSSPLQQPSQYSSLLQSSHHVSQLQLGDGHHYDNSRLEYPAESVQEIDEDEVDSEAELEQLLLSPSQIMQNEELTVKDRQEQINQSHPFGMRLWKPALYKKTRSIILNTESTIRSSPFEDSKWMYFNIGNVLWLFIFGLPLGFIYWITATLVYVTSFGYAKEYTNILRNIGGYLIWPFGKWIERHDGPILMKTQDPYDNSAENSPLLGRPPIPKPPYNWQRLLFTFWVGLLIAPIQLLVSSLCWFFVFTIPMSKVTFILLRNIWRSPLSIRAHSKPRLSTVDTTAHPQRDTVLLLCIYKAAGWEYYAYTFDGVNIIFINLIFLVFFVIFDGKFLGPWTNYSTFISSSPVIFVSCLLSTIPLSYFIGMSVASISAQTGPAIGSVINATFGSIIELILYSMALMQQKAELVEGSLIGSFLASMLLLPGLSMISGGVKKKEQRFNAKSAGVTNTMLIMSLIAAFTPTLFYQTYGRFELKCQSCPRQTDPNFPITCNGCYYQQLHPTSDPFYHTNTKPLMYFCAAVLPTVYIVGLVFTLRTHRKQIYQIDNHSHGHLHGMNNGNISAVPKSPRARLEQRMEGRNLKRRHSGRVSGENELGVNDELHEHGLRIDLSRSESRSLNDLPKSPSSRINKPSHPRSKAVPTNIATPVSPSSPTEQLYSMSYPASVPDDFNHLRSHRLARSSYFQSFHDQSMSSSVPGNRFIQQKSPSRPKTKPRSHSESHSKKGDQKSSSSGNRPNLTILTDISSQDFPQSQFPNSSVSTNSGATPRPSTFRSDSQISNLHSPTTSHHPHEHDGEQEYHDTLHIENEDGVQMKAATGHNHPEWGKFKSTVVLLACTVLFSIIADLMVDSVEFILNGTPLSAKFLGLTLFALVPSVTEFVNAIAFALQGNIELSMEIGSAYAVQVALLQIPVLVAVSVWINSFGIGGGTGDDVNRMFT